MIDWEKEFEEIKKSPGYWVETIKLNAGGLVLGIWGLFKLIVKGGE